MLPPWLSALKQRAHALRLIPDSVLLQCRVRAAQAMQQEKPNSWLAGAIILFIWLVLAVWCGVWVYDAFVLRT